jgi:hypothetical protein
MTIKTGGGGDYGETVVSACRLLQYFQSPDKNSRDISRYIYKILRYFKIVVCLFDYFCRNPQRYSVDPYLRNTAINDWSHNVVRMFLDIYVFADTCIYTRWFKYDREKLWLVYTQIVPVIFEPPYIYIWPLPLLWWRYLLLKFVQVF